MKGLKARLPKAKEWIVEKWKAFLAKAESWIETYEKRVFLILVGFIFVALILWLVPKWQTYFLRANFSEADIRRLETKERIQLEKDLAAAENSARVTIAQILGGFGLLVGLYLTYRNIKVAHKNVEVAEEGKLTERFSKVVELLGNDKLNVRLGGIYALERIARDSQKDHWTVMEVLTAFVREESKEEYLKSQHSDQQPSYYDVVDPELRELYLLANRFREDIQAALTAIGRRKWVDQERRQIIDLSESFLEGAQLFDANLSGANLAGTNFKRAILYDSNLSGAVLLRATLIGANLGYTKLDEARLDEADLTGADLSTSIGLTWEQISRAKIGEKTTLPPEMEERRKAEQGKKAANEKRTGGADNVES